MILIDAKLVAKEIQEMLDGTEDYAELYALRQAADVIEDAPTIEPKRGEWERMINPYGELEGFMCGCGHQSQSASNYCPNCGAKMEGAE